MKITNFFVAIMAVCSFAVESNAQEEPEVSGGVVFVDADPVNGEYDEGEELVSGATVVLISLSGGDAITVASGLDGSFDFIGVPNGDYQLQVTFPSGFVFKGEPFTVTPGSTFYAAVPILEEFTVSDYTNFTSISSANIIVEEEEEEIVVGTVQVEESTPVTAATPANPANTGGAVNTPFAP